MSEWTPAIAFYLDVDAVGGLACLLEAKTSSLLSDTPSLVQGDCVNVQLYFRKRAASPGGNSEARTLAAGSKLYLAAKLPADLDDGDPLFSASSFAAEGSDDDACYQALLNLDTEEVAEAFAAAEAAYLDLYLDVEVQNADNSERVTFRFALRLLQQVYAGEAEPAPGTPSRAGTVAIPEGQDYVAVADLDLSFTPAQVLVSVRKPAGGDNLWATVRDGSISDDGFTADLSAAAGAGYKLDYMLIEGGVE
jgi:hypothetical protein